MAPSAWISKLGGWPIQIQQGAIASAGGTLAAKSLPAPLRIGALNASVSRGGIDFAPTEVSFAPDSSGSRAERENDPTGGDAPEVFRIARVRLSPGKWRVSLAAGLEFLHRRRNFTRAGLACFIRGARAAHQFRLDRCGRLGGKDARSSPRGVARDPVAWNDGFSWADFESRVRQSARALVQSARRICACCNGPSLCPRRRHSARLGMARLPGNIRTSNGRSICPRTIWTPRNLTAGWGRAQGPASWRDLPARIPPPLSGSAFRTRSSRDSWRAAGSAPVRSIFRQCISNNSTAKRSSPDGRSNSEGSGRFFWRKNFRLVRCATAARSFL